MGYKAVARLKVGRDDSKAHKGVYIERGEDVSSGDVEDLDKLIADRSVVDEETYAVMFPEAVQGSNQATGTPSNLEQVEGTELQQNPPEVGEDGGQAPGADIPVVNPADVVPVEGATDASEEEQDHSDFDPDGDEDDQ